MITAQALPTADLQGDNRMVGLCFRLFHLLCLSSYTKPQPLVEGDFDFYLRC